MLNIRKRSGFTLIELLVVIAIIGILAGLVTASLNSARAKARDAERKSDLAQIKVAQELYYADHGEYAPCLISINYNSGTPDADGAYLPILNKNAECSGSRKSLYGGGYIPLQAILDPSYKNYPVTDVAASNSVQSTMVSQVYKNGATHLSGTKSTDFYVDANLEADNEKTVGLNTVGNGSGIEGSPTEDISGGDIYKAIGEGAFNACKTDRTPRTYGAVCSDGVDVWYQVTNN